MKILLEKKKIVVDSKGTLIKKSKKYVNKNIGCNILDVG